MNCSEAERRIYLYKELTPREQEETQRHIATCMSCKEIMDRVKSARIILRPISQTRTDMPDKGVMAARVMNAVRKMQQKKQVQSNIFPSNVFIHTLRYAMAALSLFLLVAFVNEQDMEIMTPPLQLNSSLEDGQKPELNSASFHDALIAVKEKNKNHPRSLYDCVMLCVSIGDADCKDCGIKTEKLN
jgi:hypothetical protein